MTPVGRTTPRAPSPWGRLASLGQSVWLDACRRGMLSSGELAALVDESGLRGVTIHPGVLAEVLDASGDYDDLIRAWGPSDDAERLYEQLVVGDAQRIADLLHPLFDATGGADGYVVLPADVRDADDSDALVARAKHAWRQVGRPNVLVSVAATEAGVSALRRLVDAGVGVNATLLFDVPRYRQVAAAYLEAVQTRLARGQAAPVTSVASLFVSPIDVEVDAQLETTARAGGEAARSAARWLGRAGVAEARRAYTAFRALYAGERGARLVARGVRPQRLVWAATQAPQPASRDVRYIEALIAPNTVTNVSLALLRAFAEHGAAILRPGVEMGSAGEAEEALWQLGIDAGELARRQLAAGVSRFAVDRAAVLQALERRRQMLREGTGQRQTAAFGGLTPAVEERLGTAARHNVMRALWCRDRRRLADTPTAQAMLPPALGWLDLPARMRGYAAQLQRFAAEVRQAGFRHVLQLGMGGSSLADRVLQRIIGRQPDGLPVTVLDSVVPATVRHLEQTLPLSDTLVIVTSRSGVTAETRALADHFFALLQAIEPLRAGEHFVAITEPDTPLGKDAAAHGFRRVFFDVQDVAGPFSALALAALLPAALAGIDIGALLHRARGMMRACAACVPAGRNPALVLGAALAELVCHGRDKLTVVTSRTLAPFGPWLEHLLAHCTGKGGTGLVPVVGEAVGRVTAYGDDRVLVHLRLQGDDDAALLERIALAHAAGHPVISIRLRDLFDVSAEMVRWQLAVTVAARLLGLSPFDTPDVQPVAAATQRLLARAQIDGSLPTEPPTLRDGRLRYYAREPALSAVELLAQLFDRTRPGDYVALLAYLPEDPACTEVVQAIRMRIRDSLALATTVGFAPRYLHSTAQLHLGGANRGAFLLLTADMGPDVGLPQRAYGLATLLRAQALADWRALRRHGRRVLRVDLGDDVRAGLAALQRTVATALMGGLS